MFPDFGSGAVTIFQNIYEAILGLYNHIVNFNYPNWLMQTFFNNFLYALPPPNYSIVQTLQQVNDAFAYFITYITWMDYFINLASFVFLLLACGAIEAALVPSRIERFIKSHII